MENVNENDGIFVYEGKTIKVSEFPSLLAQQVSQITDNSKNIDEAKKKADKARTAAEKAKNEKVKWNNKIASIKALQEALEPMIEALDGQTDIAISLSESIRAVSDATRFLFVIGVSNMAANRMVIRELELRLSNASKEQISDLAQQELRNVLKQLKAQEHIFAKLDAIETKVKSINTAYQDIEARYQYLETKCQYLETRIKAQEGNSKRLDLIESKNKYIEESTNSIKTKQDSLLSWFEQHKKALGMHNKNTIISKTLSIIAIVASVLTILFVFLR